MHLLLTDRLACPRCGPRFGLVLLADRMRDRRVLEGVLGCPNCRDRFPVRGGFGDLRAPPRAPLTPVGEAPGAGPGAPPRPPGLDAPESDATLRVAALLGIVEGPGHVALVGPVAGHAGALADLVEELEVVAVTPLLRDAEEREGVSRMVAGPGLPFFTGSLRGVVVAGEGVERFLDEAARVVAPAGRLVVLGGDDVRARLEAASYRILLEEDGAVVASRETRSGGRTGQGVALPVFPGPTPESSG